MILTDRKIKIWNEPKSYSEYLVLLKKALLFQATFKIMLYEDIILIFCYAIVPYKDWIFYSGQRK